MSASQALASNAPAGGAVALIHYLNEICQSREIVANDAFYRMLTRGSLVFP